MTKIAFVCVGNAGRSQMATELARRERDRRGLDVDIVTGGVDPADSVHEEVRDLLDDEGMDIGDRKPRNITPVDIEDAAYVVTMGCDVDQFRPNDWSGESQRWELTASETREQFEELERRVSDFFDELD